MTTPRRVLCTFDARSLEPLAKLQARGERFHAITIKHNSQERMLLVPGGI
jgi:hypothetical protein